MFEKVPNGTSWLAKAANAAAINLPHLVLGNGQVVGELILVRYAKSNSMPPFIWQTIRSGNQQGGMPPMWTDVVTEIAAEISELTSHYSPIWVELQVLKLGFPAGESLQWEEDFDSQSPAPVTVGFLDNGSPHREYCFRMDIHSQFVARIPFTIDGNGKLVP